MLFLNVDSLFKGVCFYILFSVKVKTQILIILIKLTEWRRNIPLKLFLCSFHRPLLVTVNWPDRIDL